MHYKDTCSSNCIGHFNSPLFLVSFEIQLLVYQNSKLVLPSQSKVLCADIDKQ